MTYFFANAWPNADGHSNMFTIILFFLIVVALVPWLAYKSRKQGPIATEHLTSVLAQAIITQVILTGIALITWYTNDLSIAWLEPIKTNHVLTLLAVLTAGFLLQWVDTKFLPRTEGLEILDTATLEQKSLKQVVFLSAAFGEEIVYRGVLFTLLFAYSDSTILSSVFVAAIFGLAHFRQGPKGIVFSFIMSLILQACMLQSGLLMASVAHYCINFMAELLRNKVDKSQPA